ncbi:hypothetical protein HY641_00745 [Candidatus Woesearchaeota archaeon]|nr:hypothetical protein [Candidatus Woesearchaeota archaeon]
MRNAQISWFILIVFLLVILFVSCRTYLPRAPASFENGAQVALDECLEKAADQSIRIFALQGLLPEQGLNAWVGGGVSRIPSVQDIESGLALLAQESLQQCQPMLPEKQRLTDRGPALVRVALRNESVAFEADAVFSVSNGASAKIYDKLSAIIPSHLDEQYRTGVGMAQGHLAGKGIDITDSMSRKLDIDLKKTAAGIEVRIADPGYTQSNPAVLAFVLF